MYNRIVMLCLAGIILCASNALAFDGERKGFVLGLGMGAASVTWEGNAEMYALGDDYDETTGAVSAQLVIGWAIDYHNLLAYETTGNIANSEALRDQTLTTGTSGIYWYHYFGDEGRSWFTTVGLGRYIFNPEVYASIRGTGLVLGGGYEFAVHWQVRLAAVFGRTDETISGRRADLNHREFMVTVSCFAY